MTDNVETLVDWRDTVGIDHTPIRDRCNHPRVLVSDCDWLVTCQDCGKTVDPVQYLRNLAERGDLLRRKERAFEKLDRLILRLINAGGRIVIDQKGCRSELPVDGKKGRRSGQGFSSTEGIVTSIEAWDWELKKLERKQNQPAARVLDYEDNR